MKLTEPFVLAPDVMIIDLDELPRAVREEIGGEGGFALTQPRARSASSLIDAAMAGLLNEFKAASTIVQAVIRYSRQHDLDPDETLTGSFPVLSQCIDQGYLVPPGTEFAGTREVLLATGDRTEVGTVLRCVQILEDTEIYQLACDDGTFAALKVIRPGRSGFASGALEREERILDHLSGRVAPRLLGSGRVKDNPWLALEWCEGVAAGVAGAARRRGSGDAALIELCRQIAVAYQQLHDLGVAHGDVHPNNILVGPQGSVRLIDFGLGRFMDSPREGSPVPRGGVPSYFDPRYVAALAEKRPIPNASSESDLYSLAAMFFELITGSPYLDLSIEPSEMYRQILEDPPLPFTRRGRPGMPGLETVLKRALAKDPAHRYRSAGSLAEALAGQTPTPACGAPTGRMSQTGMESVLEDFLAHVRPGGHWFENGLPNRPRCSVAYGGAGVAAALYRIACLQEKPELLTLADEWIVRSDRGSHFPDAFHNPDLQVTLEVTGKVSLFHARSGVRAVQALVSNALVDPYARQEAIEQFVLESSQPCANLDLTVGRASTLLGSSLLLEAMKGTRSCDSERLVELGNRTLDGIWAELATMPTIREAKSLKHLGAAHGWAGVLYATLRWCRVTGLEYPVALGSRLEELADLAVPAGMGIRWPWTNEPGSEGNYMPGWCNGSAGHVYLWTLAHSELKEQRWGELAEQAAWDTYTSGGGITQLCCGMTGQSYALLEAYRHFGEQRWLSAALELGARAAAGPGDEINAGLIPGSLHKGAVGTAVLAADLARPEQAAMPVFACEGW